MEAEFSPKAAFQPLWRMCQRLYRIVDVALEGGTYSKIGVGFQAACISPMEGCWPFERLLADE